MTYQDMKPTPNTPDEILVSWLAELGRLQANVNDQIAAVETEKTVLKQAGPALTERAQNDALQARDVLPLALTYAERLARLEGLEALGSDLWKVRRDLDTAIRSIKDEQGRRHVAKEDAERAARQAEERARRAAEERQYNYDNWRAGQPDRIALPDTPDEYDAMQRAERDREDAARADKERRRAERLADEHRAAEARVQAWLGGNTPTPVAAPATSKTKAKSGTHDTH